MERRALRDTWKHRCRGRADASTHVHAGTRIDVGVGTGIGPGTPLNSPCQEVGFISHFVVIDPTDLGATTIDAPGLMLDNFLPIPYAESLPLYPLVLKLVVCAGAGESQSPESTECRELQGEGEGAG